MHTDKRIKLIKVAIMILAGVLVLIPSYAAAKQTDQKVKIKVAFYPLDGFLSMMNMVMSVVMEWII